MAALRSSGTRRAGPPCLAGHPTLAHHHAPRPLSHEQHHQLPPPSARALPPSRALPSRPRRPPPGSSRPECQARRKVDENESQKRLIYEQSVGRVKLRGFLPRTLLLPTPEDQDRQVLSRWRSRAQRPPRKAERSGHEAEVARLCQFCGSGPQTHRPPTPSPRAPFEAKGAWPGGRQGRSLMTQVGSDSYR